MSHEPLEPRYTPDGSVEYRWVSKTLSSKEYRQSYRSWKYRVIEKGGRQVTVAFRMPTHLISPSVTELPDTEVSKYKLW